MAEAREDVDPELDRFFAMSPELLAIAGTDGRFRRLNPAWEPTLGWTTDELMAEPFVSFVHPDDVESALTEVARLAEGGHTSSVVTRFRCKDGSYRELEWSAAAEGDSIFAVARDASAMRSAVAEARHSEDLLAAVLQTAADPIVLIDEHGHMLQVNNATVTLFGYAEDEMLGNNVKMLMPEPYHSEHDGYMERYLATHEPRIIGIGREVSARKRDGTVFPMLLAVSEVATPDGSVFTGVIHDLTEVRAAQEDLERANEELEQRVTDRTIELEESLAELARSNRDLEQFAYIASHDLQAPLRNVRQGLELLDEHLTETVGASFDEEANELRTLIVGAVTRMEVMIRGLLSYSRVHRHESSAGRPVDLASLAEEVLQGLQVDLQEAGVTVQAERLPVVHGDPALLSQLLQNLIQNAIKYRSHDRPGKIEISARPNGEKWEVSVSDNGIGIDADKHERVFELFRRAHAGYDGVGLGLAICQRIVERHGGDIWVASQPGIGSTFTFSLPAGSEEPPTD